ncbi:MAG: polysaccharide biosynthesis tyrosine autokinase [Burkholderiaceae bacterium]|nr:polysaccharide biosynthesis tyrosine autokinase [Burkholderiaceae bacterium]
MNAPDDDLTRPLDAGATPTQAATTQAATTQSDPDARPRAPAARPASRTRRDARDTEAFLDSGGSSSLRGSRPSSRAVLDDDDTISLVDLAENLSDHRWTFALVALLCTLAALAYALFATPIYTVDALVQVEDKKGSGLGALTSVAQALDVSGSPVEGEIEILRSRTNVSAAVEALRLYSDVEVANRLPLVGEWLARRLDRDAEGLAIAPALPLVDPSAWAWGGERLMLAEFEVPPERLGLPMRLEIGENNRWTLRDEDDAPVLEGNDGTRAANDNGYALRIAELVARPGTQFELRRQSIVARVDQIRKDMRVAETKRQSGIMRIEYEGVSALAAARLVNAIADAYVRQNVQRRAAEAEKSLQFLEEQLPKLRSQLDRAESELNAFRNQHGTIDIPGEISALLTQTVDLEKSRLDLELKRKEAEARYERAHPVARALREQIASIGAQQKRMSERIQSLPRVQQDYLRLARDVEVNNQLYVSLLNNAQQLRVARAGTIGNVTIVDRAIATEKPSKPRRALVVAVGLLGGLAAGFLLTQLLAALRGRIRDPRELEADIGIHVSATVPVAGEQMAVDQRKHRRASVPYLLARAQPMSGAVEALRTLRLNLQLSLAETRGGRTILFTSAVPGQGKSFVSANLAYLIANAGPRVLLIDFDLRRSSIGNYFAVDGNRGVSDVLREGADPAQFVKTDPTVNLSVLPAGAAAANPGELLTTERLGRVFSWAASNYDVVIVDAPPILPVSDAVVLGGFADVTAFVVRHKRVARADVADAVQQYQLTGAQIDGFVFNCFVPSRVRYGYGARYGYYRGKYGYGTYGAPRRG